MASTGKKSLDLEEKIMEHKAFLRNFQRLIGSERLDQLGNVATIDRQLIMIDALVSTAQTELQENYHANTLAYYLYAIFTTIRDNSTTADPKVLAVEAEYQRRGGTGLNAVHSVVFFTAGSFYEHISGKELSASHEWCIVARTSAWLSMDRPQPGNFSRSFPKLYAEEITQWNKTHNRSRKKRSWNIMCNHRNIISAVVPFFARDSW